MQRMQTNQLGATNAEVNMAPTQGVQGVQEVRNVGGMGGVDSISAPLQRTFIWSGTLEWIQIGKASVDEPCQISAISNDVELELKVDTWPSKLLMPLVPKQLIRSIDGQYLKDMKRVQFYLQKKEELGALTKALMGGFAGCVCLYSMSPPPPQCDKKVMIMLYDIDSKRYLGFIPNNQSTFVEQLRKAIHQQKSKQLPASGGVTLPTSLAGAGMQPGISSMSEQQSQQHAQGMMMGSGVQVGQVQNELEAVIKQNLKKIQHLQQKVEAEHRHVITFHSEFLLKEAKFKRQLQQLRGASPRLLRPHLPANPGLRHLLQQEVHFKHQPRNTSSRLLRPHLPLNSDLRLLLQPTRYRTSARHVRAQTQFDEVSNYDSIKE